VMGRRLSKLKTTVEVHRSANTQDASGVVRTGYALRETCKGRLVIDSNRGQQGSAIAPDGHHATRSATVWLPASVEVKPTNTDEQPDLLVIDEQDWIVDMVLPLQNTRAGLQRVSVRSSESGS